MDTSKRLNYHLNKYYYSKRKIYKQKKPIA